MADDALLEICSTVQYFTGSSSNVESRSSSANADVRRRRLYRETPSRVLLSARGRDASPRACQCHNPIVTAANHVSICGISEKLAMTERLIVEHARQSLLNACHAIDRTIQHGLVLSRCIDCIVADALLRC